MIKIDLESLTFTYKQLRNINHKLTMDTSTLQILKLDPEAKLPVRQTSGSAGYDLYSLDSGIIKSNSRLLISTGIAIKLPVNTVGLIKSRSGLSVRAGIEHGAGVCDEDYRGMISCLLHNFGDEPFAFEKHTRIAQLLIVPILTPEIEEVTEFIEEKRNTRGADGFGSTGLT